MSYRTPKPDTYLHDEYGVPCAIIGHERDAGWITDDALSFFRGEERQLGDKALTVRRETWRRVLAHQADDLLHAEPGWFSPDGAGLALPVTTFDPDDLVELADRIEARREVDA